MCGGPSGYSLAGGATYRWWSVQCKDCGRVVDECASDRRTQLGTALPERWPAADEAWNNAGAHAESLRTELLCVQADAARWQGLAETAVKLADHVDRRIARADRLGIETGQ